MKQLAIRLLVPAITFLALAAVMSPAQTILPGAGLIAHVEGKVYLNEQRVELSGTPIYVVNSSIVRTEDGRAEIRLAGGVSLFLGENTAVKRIPRGGYNFSRFEVLDGSTVVATGEMGSHAICENEVTLSDFGLFRFDVLRLPELPTVPKVCGFKVSGGAAAVQLSSVIAVATPGKFLSLGGGAGDRVALQKFDPEQKDDLDNWASQRIRLRPTR